MKQAIITLAIFLSSFVANSTIHVIRVWDGYFKFVDPVSFDRDITIQLGDTVQWLPLDVPMMVHTITSTNIPVGAATFDQTWQAPADTFFQYVPQIVGLYEYECTPHVVSHDMRGSINVEAVTTDLDNKLEIETNLIVYPNPTSNVLYINDLYSKTKYEISNLNGSLIKTGETDSEIDVSALKSGTYIMEILGDIPRKIKIIKQ